MILESVDLPAPFAPSSPQISCQRNVTVASLSAYALPKTRVTPRATSRGSCVLLSGIGESFRERSPGAMPPDQRLCGSRHHISLAKTVSLMIGSACSMLELITILIGTRISFGGVLPAR